MAERETTPAPVNVFAARENVSCSPVPPPPAVEVAKFSALITRPPKPTKVVKKEIPPPEKPKAATPPPVVAKSPVPSVSVAPRSQSPMVRREKPQKPPKVTKDKEKEKDKDKKKSDKPGDVAVITETVGSYYVNYY